jgi:hypothetical protein
VKLILISKNLYDKEISRSSIHFKRYPAKQDHQNPDPQEKPVSGDDITLSQEQLCPQLEAPFPDRLPKSLIE